MKAVPRRRPSVSPLRRNPSTLHVLFSKNAALPAAISSILSTGKTAPSLALNTLPPGSPKPTSPRSSRPSGSRGSPHQSSTRPSSSRHPGQAAVTPSRRRARRIVESSPTHAVNSSSRISTSPVPPNSPSRVLTNIPDPAIDGHPDSPTSRDSIKPDDAPLVLLTNPNPENIDDYRFVGTQDYFASALQPSSPETAPQPDSSPQAQVSSPQPRKFSPTAVIPDSQILGEFPETAEGTHKADVQNLPDQPGQQETSSTESQVSNTGVFRFAKHP